MMPTISVAMATYNGARFLHLQLESLLAQTRQPNELVVTDDNSTDDTLSILEAFARRAPFQVHIHVNASKLGYKANFMHCAELCVGDLIAFSDQDDIWLPEKLEKQCSRFSEPDVMMSTHNVTLISEFGDDINRTYQQYRMPNRFLAKDVPLFCFNLGFTLMFRRKLMCYSSIWSSSIDEHHDHQRMAHDQWFCFLAAALGTTTYEPEILAQYRQHDRNTFGASKVGKKKIPMTLSLAERIAFYRRRMIAASSRANQLSVIQRTCDESIVKQVEETCKLYLRYAMAFERRYGLLEKPLMLSRLRLLIKSIMIGDYFHGSNDRFGLRGIVRDLQLVIR